MLPIILALTAGLLAISCGKEEDEGSYADSNAYLTAETVNCIATGAPGSDQIRLRTEGNRNAQFHAVITEGAEFCKFPSEDGSKPTEFTGKVGNSVYFYLDGNYSENPRHVTVKVEFDDNTFSKTLQFTQLGYSVSASYDKHAWAELPQHIDNGNYIYKTYYTTLSSSYSTVRNYTICYDTQKHISHWVAYPVHGCYIGNSGRYDIFLFDPNDQLPFISESIQQNVAAGGYNDGANRGFDRGHIIPSASRTQNVECNKQTYYATNMMPQASRFNQGAWGTLESAVRDCRLSGSYAALADTVYVVSGTYFGDGYETITSRGQTIAVPTHAWKVLLRAKTRNADKNDITKLSADELLSIGFIYENSNNSEKTSFETAVCTVEHIEQLTGFKFWNMLPDNVASEVKKQCKLSDWGNAFK